MLQSTISVGAAAGLEGIIMTKKLMLVSALICSVIITVGMRMKSNWSSSNSNLSASALQLPETNTKDVNEALVLHKEIRVLIEENRQLKFKVETLEISLTSIKQLNRELSENDISIPDSALIEPHHLDALAEMDNSEISKLKGVLSYLQENDPKTYGATTLKELRASSFMHIWFEINSDLVQQINETMPNLTYLNFYQSPITDESVMQLTNLQLNTLGLMETRITDESIIWLADHQKDLRMLAISGSYITNESLKAISKLRQLETLHIWGAAITDEGLKYLDSLSNLNDLSLRGCRKITGVGIAYLQRLPIERLALNHTALSDKNLKIIGAIKTLEELHLLRTDLSGSGLYDLRSLVNLRELNLEGTSINREDLVLLLSFLNELKLLNLKNIDNLQELDIQYLEIQFPNIHIAN